jgi:hypothetical protein
MGVNIDIGVDIRVSAGMRLDAGAQETKIIAPSENITNDFVFILSSVMQGTAQRCALPAAGENKARK